MLNRRWSKKPPREFESRPFRQFTISAFLRVVALPSLRSGSVSARILKGNLKSKNNFCPIKRKFPVRSTDKMKFYKPIFFQTVRKLTRFPQKSCSDLCGNKLVLHFYSSEFCAKIKVENEFLTLISTLIICQNSKIILRNKCSYCRRRLLI